MTINQPQFARFASQVKAGKVPGATAFSVYVTNICVNGVQLFTFNHKSQSWAPDAEDWDGEPILFAPEIEAILCAHLRRVLTEAGWRITLTVGVELTIIESVKNRVRPRQDGPQFLPRPETHCFDEGSELDWHIAAILAHIERSGEPDQAVTK